MHEKPILVEINGNVSNDDALGIVLGRLENYGYAGEEQNPDLILIVDRMPNLTLAMVQAYLEKDANARIIISSSIPEKLKAAIDNDQPRENVLVIAPHRSDTVDRVTAFLQK